MGGGKVGRVRQQILWALCEDSSSIKCTCSSALPSRQATSIATVLSLVQSTSAFQLCQLMSHCLTETREKQVGLEAPTWADWLHQQPRRQGCKIVFPGWSKGRPLLARSRERPRLQRDQGHLLVDMCCPTSRSSQTRQLRRDLSLTQRDNSVVRGQILSRWPAQVAFTNVRALGVCLACLTVQ